jgi:hypothetical protein
MASSSIPSGSGGGLAPKYQKFTSSGTFTLPDGYGAAKPLLISIQVIGGGGGGQGTISLVRNGTANSYSTNNYFGAGWGSNWSAGTTNFAGKPGSSGGLAATQMYLTANLTITVGAAGTRGINKTFTDNGSYTGPGNGWNPNSNTSSTTTMAASASGTVSGGTGGTTTAGSVSATGGVGGTSDFNANNARIWVINGEGGYPRFLDAALGSQTVTGSANAAYGAAGNPAGTVGDAVPLLGTLAGGSTNNTPVYGSFGIGGIPTDGATSTGVEGTGGGLNSIGAPGAVVITWWQ